MILIMKNHFRGVDKMEFLREKGESSRQSKQQVGNSDVKADRVTKIVEDSSLTGTESGRQRVTGILRQDFTYK